MPSEAFGRGSGRIMIGETYLFDDRKGGKIVGTVTAATVNEPEQQVTFGITEPNGQAHLMSEPMSADELADYRANPEAYFGKIMPVSRKITDNFEFFEWMMEAHKDLSRETLLERMAAWT